MTVFIAWQINLKFLQSQILAHDNLRSSMLCFSSFISAKVSCLICLIFLGHVVVACLGRFNCSGSLHKFVDLSQLSSSRGPEWPTEKFRSFHCRDTTPGDAVWWFRVSGDYSLRLISNPSKRSGICVWLLYVYIHIFLNICLINWFAGFLPIQLYEATKKKHKNWFSVAPDTKSKNWPCSALNCSSEICFGYCTDFPPWGLLHTVKVYIKRVKSRFVERYALRDSEKSATENGPPFWMVSRTDPERLHCQFSVNMLVYINGPNLEILTNAPSIFNALILGMV